MMSYIYGETSRKDEGDDEIKINTDNNEIFVIDNYNNDDQPVVHLSDLQQCFQTWKSVTESASCDCPYYNNKDTCNKEEEEEDEEEDEQEEDGCPDVDRLNHNDEDELIEDKIYIISMNNIPYFYDNNLTSVRNTMWDIANSLLKNNENEYDTSKHYILTNNSNEVKIIYPFNFLWLFNYNYTVAELKIDYAIKYNIIDNIKKKQE